jgi:hypothetical protein
MKNLPKSKLTKDQKRKFKRPWGNGNAELEVTLRFDDECGNGHNTFSITGYCRAEGLAGCIHDEIVQVCPELKPLIKWHLTSTDGPLHYLANALYLASDKDCWGKRKGEEKDWKTEIFFDQVPIPFSKYSERFVNWLQKRIPGEFPPIVEIAHAPDKSYNWKPKFSFEGYCEKWHECPFDDRQEAENFRLALHNCKVTYKKTCVAWGEGKEPELEAARRAALWPEASLEDFTEEKLLARLPKLMKEFKKDMEGLGFIY